MRDRRRRVVFGAARDLLPVQARNHFRLIPTDLFDPLRRNENLSARQPSVDIECDEMDGPVSVINDEIVHAAYLVAAGLEVITDHFVGAAQMLIESLLGFALPGGSRRGHL